MCGRFTLRTPTNLLVEQFMLESSPELRPRFNIAPTQPVAVVRRAAESPGVRRLDLLRWGLVPGWAKDPGIGNRLINARAETAADKPAFRGALRRRRCLILADGYFEWRKTAEGKQPYYLRMRDDRPFAFAGLWEVWRGEPGSSAPPLETCVIITTEANEISRPIHDRMPAILRPGDYELWLDPEQVEPRRIQPLLAPYDSSRMTAHRVSTRVNNPRNDDPECIAPQPPA